MHGILLTTLLFFFFLFFFESGNLSCPESRRGGGWSRRMMRWHVELRLLVDVWRYGNMCVRAIV